jgi:predicted TIM-barrel fold metal-dependent hydrolase
MLPSTGLAHPLGAKEYWPVYDAADRLGCALAVHGGAHEGLGMDNMNQFIPVHALGHPIGLMVGFGSMVFNGVLDRFANLRVGFLEGGIGWLPLCLERFDRSHETFIDFDPDGEYLLLGEGEKVSDRVRRHTNAGRLFVGCEGAEATMAGAIQMVGSGPFMFSSDFPHEVNNAYCKHEIEEILEHEALTPDDRQAILHGNAERFYGLA